MIISFLGDIAIDNEIFISRDVIEFVSGSDFIVANIEGVILKKKDERHFKTYGSRIFNSKDGIRKLIQELGITHANIYNNHSIDYGETALNNTISFLSDLNVVILHENNLLKKESSQIKIHNSGMAETFGIYAISRKYGININDMFLNKNLNDMIKNNIVYSHFGIEQIQGLSAYEYAWFDHISSLSPKIIVRHHPHCIQPPFILNNTYCFPSIGDFAFNFDKKKNSIGMIVKLDTANSKISWRHVNCKNHILSLTEKPSFDLGKAKMLSTEEKQLLKKRYCKEYRENWRDSLKKSLKYILGKEKSSHVLAMSTKHFIQPFVLDELL